MKRKRWIPKHERIGEKLRASILDGSLLPGAKLPPDSELFRRYGVHRWTMVKALNGLVRDGLIVRRRGDGTYVASRHNPPLIPGRHLRIGLLWRLSLLPENLSTFQGRITRGILSAWGMENLEADWPRCGNEQPTRALWHSTERGVTIECLGESNMSRERHPEFEAVRSGRFDGLMCLSITQEAWLKQVLELDLPTVLVDFPIQRPMSSTADVVYADPLLGHYGAVEHFASCGLKRIAFLGSRITLPTPSPMMTDDEAHAYRAGKFEVDPDSFLRLSACRQAIDEFGLSIQDNWISHEWHHAEAMSAVAARFLSMPENERPQAAICHSIGQAQHLIGAFAEQGHSFAAAGTTSSPAVGAALGILLDGRWLGEAAAALMISRLQQPARPRLRVGVPMQLEKRNAERTVLHGSPKLEFGA